MEHIKSINLDRILWCCADSGITLDQLAKDLDIAPSTFEGLQNESGKGLSFGQLRKIANYFGMTVLFFVDDGSISVEKIRTPAFRTIANQKPEIPISLKKLIERTETQKEIYLNLLDDLQEADISNFSPPKVDGVDIKTAATLARNWLGLEGNGSFDIFRDAIEAKGILVFRSNGYKGKWQIPKESPILGFNLYDKEHPLIFVRKHLSESKQNFTLMHELGHVILHRNSSIDDDADFMAASGRESEANKFAGLILVPDKLLLRINDEDRPRDVADYDLWLKEFSLHWGASVEVILRRLLDEGRLPQSKYAAYKSWWNSQGSAAEDAKGSRKYRHREPKHIFGGEFVRVVIGSMQAGKVTLNKASKYLDGISIRDLHQLEAHLAGH